MKKMLVVYYSWSNGNTGRIARKLADETDADIVRIETLSPYKGSYNDVVSQGRREVERGFMPEIRPLNANINDYDVIAVGTPTWWYTMAPAVRTFLHGHDWNGRTVIPFMTNGGWPGHVIKDMEKECTGAQFPVSMQVKFDSNGGDRMETSEKDVDAFIAKVKEVL
ncbi:MAG: flavodoxin [Anaerovoracaceae bacterium]|jgi:flavodoxin